MARDPERSRRGSRVPTGRLERLARIGMMAGEFALGGAVERVRRALGGGHPDLASVFLSTGAAEGLARRLARMRGAAMKLGQILSLEGDQLVPAEFADALAVLRASADAMPASQVRRVLGREYGKGWEARFHHFDFAPVAAASIGQVHRALTGDGRDLALKIQYPGVARSIDDDVDNLATLLRLARVLPLDLDVEALAAEAKRQLRREADYRTEAANVTRYAALVADEPAVRVPRVHHDFSTLRVLALDFVPGEPIESMEGHRQSDRNALGALLHRLVLRELFEFRFMQTDPNFANYRIEAGSGRLVLLDFGAAQEVPAALAGHYARLFRAALARDRTELLAASLAIGFAHPADPPHRVEGLLDLILLVCEPLRHRGVYDFGRSDLAIRARDAGFELAFGRGFLRPPPPETLFLHRKLAGTFFLCARLGARVDVRSILEPFLQREPAGEA